MTRQAAPTQTKNAIEPKSAVALEANAFLTNAGIYMHICKNTSLFAPVHEWKDFDLLMSKLRGFCPEHLLSHFGGKIRRRYGDLQRAVERNITGEKVTGSAAYNFLYENEMFYDKKTRIHMYLANYDLKKSYGLCLDYEDHLRQLAEFDDKFIQIREGTLSVDGYSSSVTRGRGRGRGRGRSTLVRRSVNLPIPHLGREEEDFEDEPSHYSSDEEMVEEEEEEEHHEEPEEEEPCDQLPPEREARKRGRPLTVLHPSKPSRSTTSKTSQSRVTADNESRQAKKKKTSHVLPDEQSVARNKPTRVIVQKKK